VTQVLYVVWQDPVDRCWYPVGRLTRGNGGYSFAYTRGSKRSPRFIPFGRMTDLETVYESRELFPLFANRLLSKERPEYRDFLNWLNLSETEEDALAQLGRTGGTRETDSLVLVPCPSPTETGEYQVKFFAHGLRYLSDTAIQAVNRLTPSSRLFLMPDPQNEHDRLAIALRTGEPKSLVGYCPRYLTGDLHFLLKALNADEITIVAERVNQDAPIQLRLLCAVTAMWPEGFQPCSAEDYQILAPASRNVSAGALP